MGLFTPKELKQLSQNTLEDGKILIDSSESKGIQTITPACKAYPQRLYQIDNPPCMLYVKGTLPNLDEQPAAVVGTRNATTTGKQITYDLSMQLAQAGMVIVSGGAKVMRQHIKVRCKAMVVPYVFGMWNRISVFDGK